jgi:beta-glucanase (GH16 family)
LATTSNTTPKLTFQEDFSNQINITASGRDSSGHGTWKSQWFWDSRYSDDKTDGVYFSDSSTGYNPFSQSNGVLSITAKPIDQTGVSNEPDWVTHASGMLQTDEMFSQKYGYFEFSAKNAPGDGFASALWLIPSDHSWPPEIDVSEVDGGEPRTVINTVHTQTGNARSDWTDAATSTTTEFHTYGLDWGPSEIIYYLDGKETFRTATPSDANKPMYLTMSLHVGADGSWHGNANDEAAASMQIDYVKAWEWSGGGIPPGAVGAAGSAHTNPAPAPTAPAQEPILTPSVAGHVIDGNAGNNYLTGTSGADKIYAGSGNDKITGAKGNDQVWNGPGHDTNVYHNGDGNDIIWDFAHGTDKLQLVGVQRSEVSWAHESHDGASGTMLHVGASEIWMPNAAITGSDVFFT